MDKSVRCACQIFSGFHIQKNHSYQFIFDRVIKKIKKADVFGTQCSCYITFAITLIVVVLYNVHCLHAVLRCSPFYACRTSVSSILAVQKRLNWSRCRLEGGGADSWSASGCKGGSAAAMRPFAKYFGNFFVYSLTIYFDPVTDLWEYEFLTLPFLRRQYLCCSCFCHVSAIGTSSSSSAALMHVAGWQS